MCSDKCSYKVSKLWEGCDYVFRVASENAVGQSDYCSLDRPVTAKLPYSKPCCFTVSHVRYNIHIKQISML